MSKQSENRRAAKKLKVGDRVTWGTGNVVYTVEAVVSDGILTHEPDGRMTHFRFKWSSYHGRYTLRHA